MQSMVCFEIAEPEFPVAEIKPLTYGILILVSCLFLTITLIVFMVKMLAPKVREVENVYFVILISCTCLYVIFGAAALAGQQIFHQNLLPSGCVILGKVIVIIGSSDIT